MYTMPNVDSNQTGNRAPRVRGEADHSVMALLSIVLGCCFAIALVTRFYVGKNTNFEDAATFGAGTSIVMASVGGFRIHCGDSRDSDECLAGAKARGATQSVLWLGNSQVHAVNQLQEGETNAPPILFDRLKAGGLDLVAFSQPNASLQEHYVLFEYLQRRLPLRVVIVPTVFDDTREDGLRKEVADFLDDPGTRLALSATAIGAKILRSTATASKVAGSDTAAISNTLQERLERFLNARLAEHSDLWMARPELRGRLMVSLFLWRNTVLGITPTSKRRIIRGRYQDNMAALEAILGAAASRGVAVLLYIVPLRKDVDPPYVDSEYQGFKDEVHSLADRYAALFANLEDLVPAELWGSKETTSFEKNGQELDFMHFRAGGHKLLAARLAELVANLSPVREDRP